MWISTDGSVLTGPPTVPHIRLFETRDGPAVAEMFTRLLARKSQVGSTSALAAYLGELFCEQAGRDRPIRSLVHVGGDDRPDGFIGVLEQAMTLNGRRLRAAICTTWMVDDRRADPFAGARLLKAVLAGPQDLTFSETSNELSTAMWRRAGGHVLPDHSLEYLRVIHPASFFTRMAADRFGPLAALAPLCRLVDRASGVGAGAAGLSWAGYRPRPGKADALVETEPDEAELATAMKALVEHHPLHPQWSDEHLAHMLAHAARKAKYGARIHRILRTRNGELAGLFVCYGNRNGIGRVIQLMAKPGMERPVLTRLLTTAHGLGLCALRGRTQPALLDAMLDQKFAFLHAASTVFHSPDSELVDAARQGRAFLNGFSGESWARLIGDRFA